MRCNLQFSTHAFRTYIHPDIDIARSLTAMTYTQNATPSTRSSGYGNRQSSFRHPQRGSRQPHSSRLTGMTGTPAHVSAPRRFFELSYTKRAHTTQQSSTPDHARAPSKKRRSTDEEVYIYIYIYLTSKRRYGMNVRSRPRTSTIRITWTTTSLNCQTKLQVSNSMSIRPMD